MRTNILFFRFQMILIDSGLEKQQLLAQLVVIITVHVVVLITLVPLYYVFVYI